MRTGGTNISMYPKVFEAMSVSYPELVDRLIRHALARTGSRPASPGVARGRP
jgi:D-alanine-D-alanine ligase